MKPLELLVRPCILSLKPYSTARDEYAGGEIDVWLDANECPYDVGTNRYPDPHQRHLKQLIAETRGLSPRRVFIGNGSDEAIDLVYRIFCNPGIDNVVSITPTYGMYSVAAAINDVAVREVPLGPGFSLPVDDMLARADDHTKVMWLCSPNNPTGNAFDRADILRLADSFDGMVVVDEAYADFSTRPSLVDSIDSRPNLIVLQTMSKARAMAALRVGMAFASEPVIELMDRVKYPYNVNALSQQIAIERAGADIDPLIAVIKAGRAWLTERLAACDTVRKVYPSDANFLLVKVDDADALYDHLIARGIIVRNRSTVPGCESCLRVTVGTPEQNERLLKAVTDFKPRQK